MDNTHLARFLGDWAVVHMVLKYCVPSDIMRLAKTCTGFRTAVYDYTHRAWSIIRFLDHFFFTPRRLLAILLQTDSVIAGFNVNLFLERRPLGCDDLEIYAPYSYYYAFFEYLREDGYSWLGPVEPSEPPWGHIVTEPSEPSMSHSHFLHTGIYKFSKNGRIVMVFFTNLSTVCSILRCPFTCQMNLITGEGAYSLYPRETVEYRCTLSMRQHLRIPARLKADAFLNAKGIAVFTRAVEIQMRYPDVFQPRERWVGDGHTWVIPFPLNALDVDVQPRAVPLVTRNGWMLSQVTDGTPRHSFYSFGSSRFLHRYCIPFDFLRLIGPQLYRMNIPIEFHNVSGRIREEACMETSTFFDYKMARWKAEYDVKRAEREFTLSLVEGGNTHGKALGMTYT